MPRIDTIPLADLIDTFEISDRTTRDCAAFGPFLFDRNQYDKAVQDLDAAIAAPVPTSR
ncbi:hypothetical protein ACFTS5_13520 [Nocardia sp. NPDC056952]|uniref:hypothetical protein n=1 Tax=Nocardia sp. NPDC056952 TaxID=3345979 RepID=UPI003643FCF5